jgi:hypothetical protein
MPDKPKRPRPDEASLCCTGGSVKASSAEGDSSPDHEKNRATLHDPERRIGGEQMMLVKQRNQRQNGYTKGKA